MASEAELIKSRLLLSEVIRKKVHLQNKGSSGYVGLCPFHKEKTPSFFVNDERAHYHCFGCGAHGDIFTFLMQYEGLDYKEALKQLAYIAGVELTKQDGKAKAQMEKNKIFFQIYEKATEFYHKQLFSKLGKRALDYILSRGITLETIANYKLGFSPKDPSHLIKSLLEDFTEADLFASGIIQRKNDFTYDPLYNRLIFPIQDQFKKFIAFGGRIIDGGQPKYLNSAENPIFKKSHHLYGYSSAKNYIYKQKEVIVVEGYMDAIALTNKEIYNVVAPLGANIKLSQIEMLWSICSEPTICFDGDEAGQNAAMKIARESLKYISHNKSLKFTKLVHGKDPDEVIRNKGVKFFEQLIKKSVPLADYIFDNEATKIILSTPEKKSLLLENALKMANEISNAKVRNNYVWHYRSKYWDLLRSLNTNKTKNTDRHKGDTIINMLSLGKFMLAENKDKENFFIISILYNYPELLNDNKIVERFISIALPNSLDKIRKISLSLKFSARARSFHDEVVSAMKTDNDLEETLKNLMNFSSCSSQKEARISLLRAFDIKELKDIKEKREILKTQILKAREAGDLESEKKLMKEMLCRKREYELENRLRDL